MFLLFHQKRSLFEWIWEWFLNWLVMSIISNEVFPSRRTAKHRKRENIRHQPRNITVAASNSNGNDKRLRLVYTAKSLSRIWKRKQKKFLFILIKETRQLDLNWPWTTGSSAFASYSFAH
jgi:hypothetical protein